MKRNDRTDRRRGFVLVTAAVCVVALIGMLGLAADLGRVYIAKNETQAYADAAAMAAALQLDGTAEGVVRARQEVEVSPNRGNLGNSAFSGTVTEFGITPGGPWVTSPGVGASYRFVRVTAVGTVGLYFLPVVTAKTQSVVTAVAVAGQVEKTWFREGLLPFSPFGHDPSPPDFGLTRGERYTLRWAANPKLNQNLCPGDNAPEWLALATNSGSEERGYIEQNSSEVIRMAIEQDYQTVDVEVGDPLAMTGGNKQTQRDSLINRVLQDTDSTSTTYGEYSTAASGNGRRLVAVPINSGPPDNIVLGFAAFFLLEPREYEQAAGGNKPFCAEYVGPFVRQSSRKGAGQDGAYEVRLVL